MKFGKWTRLSRDGKYADCVCDCGTRRQVVNADLESGRSKSCGCTRRVTLPKAAKEANRTHGRTKTPEFSIWTNMRRRCNNPHRPDYRNYGARGITVCDEWNASFERFYADMGPRPEDCTLERLDNDKPYCKENCAWVPIKINSRNTRRTKRYMINGRKITLVEAAELYGLNVNTLYNRVVTLGWEPSRAVNEPVKKWHASRRKQS